LGLFYFTPIACRKEPKASAATPAAEDLSMIRDIAIGTFITKTNEKRSQSAGAPALMHGDTTISGIKSEPFF
jgi:hypothetical protein